MTKILVKLSLFLMISAFCIGSHTISEARTFVHHEVANLSVNGVSINAERLVVTSASGYVCSSENGLCVCRGDADSEDCQAMAENICKRDGNGDVDLSCNGITCSCEWEGGFSAGGLDGGPAQTQGVD